MCVNETNSNNSQRQSEPTISFHPILTSSTERKLNQRQYSNQVNQDQYLIKKKLNYTMWKAIRTLMSSLSYVCEKVSECFQKMWIFFMMKLLSHSHSEMHSIPNASYTNACNLMEGCISGLLVESLI